MKNKELEGEVTKIRDFQDIQNLQAKYGYYLSRGPWADWDGEMCQIFTDDATIELSGGGVYVGKEGIKKVFGKNGRVASRRKASYMNIMLQVMPYIKVYNDGTASAVWSLIGPTATGKRAPSEKEEPIAMWQLGRYENEYRKVDGVWKISKLTYRQYISAPHDQGWCEIPVLKDWKNLSIIPDRPSTEYRPYNPKATCREEQISDPVLPPDRKKHYE